MAACGKRSSLSLVVACSSSGWRSPPGTSGTLGGSGGLESGSHPLDRHRAHLSVIPSWGLTQLGSNGTETWKRSLHGGPCDGSGEFSDVLGYKTSFTCDN